jgi:hypothetical protein
MDSTRARATFAFSPTQTAHPSPDRSSISGDAISSLSTGLVQISGLSTVIGGNGLEELSIGLKAAPGLVWAPICTFGLLKVVKVWIAGAIPNAWRNILGLRSGIVDEAIGFMRWTETNKPPGFMQWTKSNRPSVFMRQREGGRVGLHMDYSSGN